MDDKTGGLSPSERQRKTAAEIARRKVLDAFAHENEQSSLKQAPVNEKMTKEDWQKYHSAWQNYYQRYYSEYYSKAARNYVATEKLKHQRAVEDEKKLLEDDLAERVETGDEGAKVEIKSRLKETIQKQASEQVKRTKRHRHLIPILFGVAVMLIFVFLQYNRLIFAPIAAYVSPGDNEASTITPVEATVAVSAEPKLIIPKLNVEVPVHFGISNDTATVNKAMNNGVAHFVIPGAKAFPGEIGNMVITGHSAGDVYSNNQYKFIFSGLERLADGDTIYINYNSVRYTYSVTGSEIVEPSDVASLTKPTDKAMLTLVTCTPLGTSRYRLLVHAEQINPVIAGSEGSEGDSDNSSDDPVVGSGTFLPANEATFFEKIWNFLTGKQ